MQNISPQTINQFLSDLDGFYHSFIEETIDFIENAFPQNVLQESVFEHLILILNQELSRPFDGVSFYWFQRVQDLLYVGELLYNMNNESSEESVKEMQEDIFIFWNNIGFGIPQNPQLSTNVAKATNELLGLLEQQIVSFYYLHIDSSIEMPHPCLYFPIHELGEKDDLIAIDFPFYLSLEKQVLPLVIKSKTDTSLHLENDEFSLSNLILSHTTSDEFNKYLEQIPSLYPIWPRIIKGCWKDESGIFTDTPFLNCSAQEDSKTILQQFANHLFSLYDLLNDDFGEDDLYDADDFSQKAQEWLLWLYKHEEKNSSFLSFISL